MRKELLGASARQPQIAAHSEAAPIQETLGLYGESAFLRAVSGKDPEKVWTVMDDLMDALQMLNRRTYDNVIRKLEAL